MWIRRSYLKHLQGFAAAILDRPPMSASKTSGRPRMKAHSKMVNSCVPAWWFKLCTRKLGNLVQLPRCRIHATPSSHGVRNGRQSSYIISTLSTEEKIWPSFHNIPGLLFLAGKKTSPSATIPLCLVSTSLPLGFLVSSHPHRSPDHNFQKHLGAGWLYFTNQDTNPAADTTLLTDIDPLVATANGHSRSAPCILSMIQHQNGKPFAQPAYSLCEA